MPEGGLDGDKWLREHNLCTLATGRRDGSPQQTLVSYHYDGKDIVISTCSYRPKWLNSKRQPRVSLLVQEGRQYTVVYGRAEHVENDPERLELTKRAPGWNRRLARHNGDEQAAVRELNEEQRVILRVVPDKIVPHS
ncbi:MAG TPA: TIGR03618 family F420-dependent PPOX class oxidoreductase [Chloroflexota bacterium]|nr:TIGR03618 family F420-dependent PPOX class oxidoreductase [Chloroflexota bacterium]